MLTQGLALIEPHRFFIDQFVLSLALQDTCLPVRQLPIGMNFPKHASIHDSFFPDEVDPYILHYHNRVTEDGKIQMCQYRKPNEVISRVNQLLKSGSSGFNNYLFWELRYRSNPEMGSGIGSRGELAIYKRNLIQSIYHEIGPCSVLDIGCGDMEVVSPTFGKTALKRPKISLSEAAKP